MVNSRPDTTVNIGKLRMKNPVTVASGTFGYGREISEFYDISKLGAITIKGVSLEPWEGNPYPRTVETPSGMLNAIGLQNEGLQSLLEEKLPWLAGFNDLPVIVNIVGHSVEEYAAVAAVLEGHPQVAALEINISCPNVSSGCIAFGSSPEGAAQVVRAVRDQTTHTLITKLSPNVTSISEIAIACEEAGSDALSLINTLVGTAIDPWKRKFRLANITGGLSGPAIKPIALRMVYEVSKAVKVPIIGMGGILSAMDAVEFMLAGATAVAVGTANFVNPLAALDIISGLEDYLIKTNTASVTQIIGNCT